MSYREFLPILPELPDALCRDIINPNVFFPVTKKEKEKSMPLAFQICAGCTMRKECLEFALDWQIPHGIWAGTTPEMRQEMLTDRVKTLPKETLAKRIMSLSLAGRVPNRIAALLNCSSAYVRRVIAAEAEDRKGAIQSNPQRKKSSKESASSSESQL